MLYIEMENRNYKSENMQRKYLKIMQKNQYFAKGKKQSFRIRKRFYRIERYRIERQRSKN